MSGNRSGSRPRRHLDLVRVGGRRARGRVRRRPWSRPRSRRGPARHGSRLARRAARTLRWGMTGEGPFAPVPIAEHRSARTFWSRAHPWWTGHQRAPRRGRLWAGPAVRPHPSVV